MPTYDYKCVKCGHEWDDFKPIKDRHKVRCVRCNGRGKIMVGKHPAGVQVWPAMWWEHIDEVPIYCRNKQEVKDACKRVSEETDCAREAQALM